MRSRQSLVRDAVSVQTFPSFEDTGLNERDWTRVAERGATHTVFQELRWQLDWWASFGRGDLLIAVARDANRNVAAIAPWFVDGGMAFLVGSGGADYLDFIGDTSQVGTSEALLGAVFDAVPGLLGARLYLVPDASPTGLRLREAARHTGLRCYDEASLLAPALQAAPGALAAAARRESLRRHERYFASRDLRVSHLRDASVIEPWLDRFFEQHVERWKATAAPSLFESDAHRRFYRRLTASAGAAGWLRFTVVESAGRPIAFHFGFSHAGRFLWYKPSFAIDLARHSPGEVLLRHLLLEAEREAVSVFDFGIGEETFKSRFADLQPVVRDWGVYRD